MKTNNILGISIIICQIFLINNAWALNRIRIAGSNSMYPIMTALIERYSYETDQPSPIMEATGTGGGIKIFCNGIGQRFPDIVAASRPMSLAEKRFCAKNGVHNIHEIKFGYDGIVLAHTSRGFDFSIKLHDLQLALNAHNDHNDTGQLPVQWSDIGRNLPQRLIRIYGPPTTSGTREAFETLLTKDNANFVLRDDDTYIEASDQENVIVQKLIIEQEAVGVFSYGFYIKNQDRLKALRIDGVTPQYDTIITGRYPLSRPLYIYVKSQPDHIAPFIKFILDPMTSGPNGYLKEYGFIALPQEKFDQMRGNALHFFSLSDIVYD